MINRNGKQPDPGLLTEEEDEDYGPPYGLDERRELLAHAGPGALFRPVETLTTTLDAPLQPDAFEHQGRTCGHGTNSRCDCYGELM